MKTLLIGLLLLVVSSCQKMDTLSTSGGSEASYTLSLDYEQCTYHVGEPIAVTLTIAGRNNPATDFPFQLATSSDHVTITLEGEPFLVDSTYVLPFEVINTNSSLRVLHFSFTSTASALSSESLDLTFRIPGAGGIEQKASLSLINAADLVLTTTYDKSPLEIEKSLGVTLLATKTNYTGMLRVTPHILRGDGYCVVYGKNYRDGEVFTIPMNTPQTIRYQPVISGTQRFSFSVTDLAVVAAQEVEIEVYNKGGLENPIPGVYLYAQGWYYTLRRWREGQNVTAEGVAIVAENCRFLLANKAAINRYWIPPADHLKYSTIQGITIANELSLALQDFDGKKNTFALVQAVKEGLISAADAASFCYHYDPSSPGKWYLISAGQMNLVSQHIEEVRECQIAIGADVITSNNDYLTSTGRSPATVWRAYYTVPFLQKGVFVLTEYSINQYHGTPAIYPIYDL